MSLRQINLRTEFKHKFTKEFNEESWCVSELYWSSLRDYPTGKIKKCTIHVSDMWKEKEFHYSSYTDYKGINLTLDFANYFNVGKLERKRIQLELIHKGMLLIAEKEGWSTIPLVKAYSHCLDEGLEYNFFLNNKLKASPDRKRKAGVWCEWDIDFFKLFWVIFDKNGVELKRNIIVSLEPSKGETVYYLTWKWSDDKTIFVEDKYREENRWLINLS